jgi:hypothetical protein
MFRTGDVIGGCLLSTIIGTFVLWLLIDKLAWGYLTRKGIPGKPPGTLSLPMGILERIMYTTVFIIEKPEFVAVWLAMRVASQWKRWEGQEPGTYNVFLMDCSISLIISYLCAWIATNRLPLTRIIPHL